MCLHLLNHARYVSFRHSESVPRLYVLKFFTSLVSRPALSAVPAPHASTFQRCLSYSLHAKAVIDISKKRTQYAKHALFTRGGDTHGK